MLFPIAGYLADHFDRGRLIALAYYVQAVVVLLCVFAPSWKWVAVSRMLEGFGAIRMPASSAILADSLRTESRASGFATMATVSGFLALLAPYIAGVVLDAYGVDLGMRVLYGAMAVANGLSAVINHVFIRETRAASGGKITLRGLASALKTSYSGIPALLRRFSPPLRALSTVAILGFMANGIASPFWVLRAETHMGFTRKRWGLVLSIEQAFRSVVGIPAGFCVDRYGRTKFILGSLVGLTIMIPLFLQLETFAQVVILRCAIGLVGAFYAPACSALNADLIPSEIRGRAMALIGRGSARVGAASGGTGGPGVGLLTILPLTLSSYAGGMLYEWDSEYAWYFASGITLVSLLLAAVFIRDPEKAEA